MALARVQTDDDRIRELRRILAAQRREADARPAPDVPEPPASPEGEPPAGPSTGPATG